VLYRQISASCVWKLCAPYRCTWMPRQRGVRGPQGGRPVHTGSACALCISHANTGRTAGPTTDIIMLRHVLPRCNCERIAPGVPLRVAAQIRAGRRRRRAAVGACRPHGSAPFPAGTSPRRAAKRAGRRESAPRCYAVDSLHYTCIAWRRKLHADPSAQNAAFASVGRMWRCREHCASQTPCA
jgi:hypothetical protein